MYVQPPPAVSCASGLDLTPVRGGLLFVPCSQGARVLTLGLDLPWLLGCGLPGLDTLELSGGCVGGDMMAGSAAAAADVGNLSLKGAELLAGMWCGSGLNSSSV